MDVYVGSPIVHFSEEVMPNHEIIKKNVSDEQFKRGRHFCFKCLTNKMLCLFLTTTALNKCEVLLHCVCTDCLTSGM